ncbi:metallophosphoesterase family protein [Mariniblastus sp.]|nr:metallophosphoesterase family protein [Mariniblastus sp.]
MIHLLFRFSLVLITISTFPIATSTTGSAELTPPSIPKHLRVSWTSDPATEAIISWSTFKPSDASAVRFRIRNSNANYSISTASQGRFLSNKTELHYHHGKLVGLAPDTAYEFQITTEGQINQTYYFITASGIDRSFSLLHGGDSRSDQTARRKMNLMIADLVTKSFADKELSNDIIALAHGGDYVADGSNLEQWIKWMDDHELTIGQDGRMLPVIPARGNHDKSELFNQVFGFKEKDNNYYAINLNPTVRFVTLNTEISTAGDQAQWLKRELKESRPRNRWLLAQYHRPAYPAVKAPGAALQSWVPTFEKNNVDLVCEADGHNIKRTLPIRGNVMDSTGVVYIGEGGLGVAQRTPKVDRWYLQPPGMSDSASHVFVLTFEPKRLKGKCIRIDEKLADEFTLKPRKIEKSQAFVVTGDPQYLAENSPNPTQLDAYSEEANKRFIELIKKLPGQAIPKESGGGTVNKNLRGLLVTGDLIDSADKSGGNYNAMQKFEWNRYKTDYGLTGKDGKLPFPVYEVHGNHDGPQGDTFIVKDIIERNRSRPGISNLSKNGLHYSWDWGPLHLVNLGMFVGEGTDRRDQFHYAPMGSLEFLISDLKEKVGTSGRPVVLSFHLHPNGPAFAWPPQDLKLFWESIKEFNVIGLFHGHTHGSPPSRIQWNQETFGSAVEGGIDVFNPDDSGAAKTNPSDAGNPIGVRHGFLYVELIDRPGTRRDELIVRSKYTKDNWATHEWGERWTKSISIPAR